MPGLGYSNQRGGFIGLNYYWVTGRSTDLTTQLDVFGDGTVGLGEEARWRPTPESAGIFQGFVVRDQDATLCVPLSQAPPDGGNGVCTLSDGSLGVYTTGPETRWKVRLDHVSDDLPYDVRGVVSVRAYSDKEYLQDWEKSFALNSAKQIPSFAYLTRNFGSDSVNLRFERNETFYAATVVQERIPSLEFFHRTAPIGNSPFFLALQSSLSGLYVNKGNGLLSGTYGRFDLNPVFSLPWKEIPWLSILAQAGGRLTDYTDSTDEGQQTFTGNSFLRSYAIAGLSLVGPSFSRIYDVSVGPWGKLKHVIEPRVDYTYVSNVSDPARIPAFDTIDTTLGQNQIRYAIVNRLLARTAGGPAGSAEEIASLEIAQTYAFTLPQTIFLPATGARRAPERTRRGDPAGRAGRPSAPGRPAPVRPHRVPGHEHDADGRRQLGPELPRPLVVRDPARYRGRPGPCKLGPDPFRGRRGPRQGLPARRERQLQRRPESHAGGPVPGDLQGLLLHGVPGVPQPRPSAVAPARRAPGREPQGHRDPAGRQRVAQRPAGPVRKSEIRSSKFESEGRIQDPRFEFRVSNFGFSV